MGISGHQNADSASRGSGRRAAGQRPVRLMAVSTSAGPAPANWPAAQRCPQQISAEITSCISRPAGRGARYSVRLSVPRRGGWRRVENGQRQLRAPTHGTGKHHDHRPHIEDETGQGRDYVRVTVVMTISAPDIAQALTAAWWVFRRAKQAAMPPDGTWPVPPGRGPARGEVNSPRLACNLMARCRDSSRGEPHLPSLIHTDTWAGSRAWCATPARSSWTASRSTASCSRAANAVRSGRRRSGPG